MLGYKALQLTIGKRRYHSLLREKKNGFTKTFKKTPKIKLNYRSSGKREHQVESALAEKKVTACEPNPRLVAGRQGWGSNPGPCGWGSNPGPWGWKAELRIEPRTLGSSESRVLNNYEILAALSHFQVGCALGLEGSDGDNTLDPVAGRQSWGSSPGPWGWKEEESK